MYPPCLHPRTTDIDSVSTATAIPYPETSCLYRPLSICLSSVRRIVKPPSPKPPSTRQAPPCGFFARGGPQNPSFQLISISGILKIIARQLFIEGRYRELAWSVRWGRDRVVMEGCMSERRPRATMICQGIPGGPDFRLGAGTSDSRSVDTSMGTPYYCIDVKRHLPHREEWVPVLWLVPLCKIQQRDDKADACGKLNVTLATQPPAGS